MLVLTRKLMEKLYIGDEICVTVVRVEGGQVRLGIDAPREISVVRAELIDGRETAGMAADDASHRRQPGSRRLPAMHRPNSVLEACNRRRGPSR